MHILKKKKVLKRSKKEQNKCQNNKVHLYVLACIENQDKLNKKANYIEYLQCHGRYILLAAFQCLAYCSLNIKSLILGGETKMAA